MPRRRSPVLAIVALLVVVAVAASAAALANRTPRLPATTAERLIASTLQALDRPPALSGSVASHVDLGLPSISGFGGGADPAGIIGGDHSIRIWISDDGVRVDDLLTMAQRSLYVGTTDAWAWDSEAFTAYHLGPFPKTPFPREPASPLPAANPLELARRALAAIDPTTSVSLAAPRNVAGRGAYLLRLQPRTDRTLIGAIEIAVDGARKVPLGVSVFARGATKPAVSVGFTSVRFGPVDPSVYRFTPPAGATVKQTTLRPPRTAPAERPRSGYRAAPSDPVRTFGSGWESIFAMRISSLPSSERDSPNLRELFPYSGPLFSVRLIERGDHAWIVGGFVPPGALDPIVPQLQ